MGRGRDDEMNGRRRERKVRKEVQSARRRQQKEGDTSCSFHELVEDLLCSGPIGIAALCIGLSLWWSYWLEPYIWPLSSAAERARTRETVQFQGMAQNCLDPHNELVQEEVDYDIGAAGGKPFPAVGNIAAVTDGLCNMSQLQVLLDFGRVDVNDRHFPATHQFGYTLLHMAAGSQVAQAPEVMGMLINAGADLDARATKLDRRTPLYLATLYNNIEQIQLLLEAGADINLGDNLKTTPVYIAVQNGHPELVRLLIAYGADVNRRTKEGWLALNVAATECRDIKQKRKLCEYPCPHLKPDEVGIATYAQIMELLLQAGAEPNRANNDGAPALHNAILCESVEMASSLLSHGANPNKISKLTHETPLWVAARQGSLSLVEALLEAGADPLKPVKKVLTATPARGVRSRRGGHMTWFPSEIATTNGHTECAERLRLAMREIEEETGYEIGSDAEDLRNKYRSPECNAMMDKTIEAGLFNPATAAIGGVADDPMVRELLQIAGPGTTGHGAAAPNPASCAAAIRAAATKEQPAASCANGPRSSARYRWDLAGIVSASDYFPLNSDLYLLGEEVLATRRRADEEIAKKQAELLAQYNAKMEAERAEKLESDAEPEDDPESSLNDPWGAHASEADWAELQELLSPLSDAQVERVMMQALHNTELLEEP